MWGPRHLSSAVNYARKMFVICFHFINTACAYATAVAKYAMVFKNGGRTHINGRYVDWSMLKSLSLKVSFHISLALVPKFVIKFHYLFYIIISPFFDLKHHFN
jgi:hypothetical protein